MSGSQQTASALGAFPYNIPVQGGQPISINPSLLGGNPFTQNVFQTQLPGSVTTDTGDTGGAGYTPGGPVTNFNQTFYGTQYPNGIPSNFLTGIDPSTQLGFDTLAARIASNNATQAPLDPSLWNDTSLFGGDWNVLSEATGLLAGGAAYSLPPTSDSAAWSINPSGYADPTSGLATDISQATMADIKSHRVSGESQFEEAIGVLSIPLAVGGAFAGAAALSAGSGALDAGSAADVATSDLGAITAGAGDAGGTAAVAGGSAADTLGSLAAFDAGGGLTDATAAASALGANTVGVAPGATDITLAPTTAETTTVAQPGGFFSDLASGNWGNLGTDLTGSQTSAGALTPTSPAAAAGYPDSLAGNVLAAPATAPAGTAAAPIVVNPADAAAAGASSPGLLTQAGQFLGSPAGKVAGAALSLGSLGYDMLKQNNIPGLSNIQSLAQQSTTQGQILQQYLQNGTLPPAVQTSIDAATRDGITAIKAKYASMGISGSSAEAEDIQRLQQNAVIQGATLADQLLQQGISETQLSGQLYAELVQANTALNTQTGQAIGALANALAGGGTTLKLAG